MQSDSIQLIPIYDNNIKPMFRLYCDHLYKTIESKRSLFVVVFFTMTVDQNSSLWCCLFSKLHFSPSTVSALFFSPPSRENLEVDREALAGSPLNTNVERLVHICFFCAIQSRKKKRQKERWRWEWKHTRIDLWRWHKINAAQHFITGATPTQTLSKHSETGKPA